MKKIGIGYINKSGKSKIELNDKKFLKNYEFYNDDKVINLSEEEIEANNNKKNTNKLSDNKIEYINKEIKYVNKLIEKSKDYLNLSSHKNIIKKDKNKESVNYLTYQEICSLSENENFIAIKSEGEIKCELFQAAGEREGDENSDSENDKNKININNEKNNTNKNMIKIETENQKIDLYFIDAHNQKNGYQNDVEDSSDEHEENEENESSDNLNNLIDFGNELFPINMPRKNSIMSGFSIGI